MRFLHNTTPQVRLNIKTSAIALMVFSASAALSIVPVNSGSLPDGSYKVAQNTFNNQGQFQQQQFTLMIENRSGADLDLLRVVNGQYQLIGKTQNGFATPVNTFGGDVLYFGYGGQQIITSFNVTPGDTRPVQIGPELLASAGIRPQQPNFAPQQQQPQNQGQPQGQGGLLPDPNVAQNQPRQPQQPVQSAPKASSLPEPQVTAAPPVSPEAQVPKQNPELAKLSERRAFKNQPWQMSPLASIMIIEPRNSKTISVNIHGELDYVPLKETLSGGTWLPEKIEGTDEVVLRNVQEPDKGLFVEANATVGSGVGFGPRGLSEAGGRWKMIEYGNYFRFQSAMNPNLYLSYQDGLTVQEVGEGFGKKVSWLAPTVKSFRDLMGFLEDNLDSLAESAEKMNQIDRQVAAEKKAKLEEEERQRLAIQRTPWISGGGNGENYLTVRMGFENVEKVADTPEVYGQRYYFKAPGSTPRITAGPFYANSNGPFTVNLDISPEVYAFVENGILFVRVKSRPGDGVSIRQNGSLPGKSNPENIYYVGGVAMSVFADGSVPDRIKPQNTNERIDVGTSSDTTSGVDLSIDSIGGNYSESLGKNVNQSILDYKITGRKERWHAAYSWDGCGLATNVSSVNACTYNSPADLWQNDGALIKDLKDVMLDMPLLETDTLLQITIDKQQLAAREYITVGFKVRVLLHALNTRWLTTDDENGGWKAFKSGAEFVFRPDKWDFTADLEDQEVLKNRNTVTEGVYETAEFDVNLQVNISQLTEHLSR